MNEWVCSSCKSINRPSARSCYSCGGPKGAAPVAPNDFAANDFAPNDFAPSAMAVGQGAAGTATMAGLPFAVAADGGSMSLAAEVAAAPETPATPAGPMDLLGGLVGGVVGAVVATAVWYGVVAASQFQVGLVAIAVGWLVGQGVVFGAQRRVSVALIPVSVVLTLVALALSEYLIVMHFFSQELGPVDLLQPPGLMLEVVTLSLQADPLTLAFWAIALFQAFMIPARAARPSGS